MNDFLRNLVPGIDQLGLIRTVTKDCPLHGPYESRVYGYRSDDGYDVVSETPCEQCNAEKELVERRRATEQRRLLELTGKIGIAPRFAHCSFENYQVDSQAMIYALNACESLALGNLSSLFLCGPTGRGKTHLLVATLKESVVMGDSSLYVTEAMIYRHIRESYLNRKDCMTESQVINRYSNVKVLGIDEIGRSSWTEHEARILGEIITNRYNHCNRTILATNLFPAQLHGTEDKAGYFDDAILRKLAAKEVTTAWKKYQEDIA
ncbi:MAG: ATP-binding protein [Sphaerochaeta sp.]|nr:ATP-binding protein [Sphaerochaeta sp.]